MSTTDATLLAELASLRKTCEVLMRRVEAQCATPQTSFDAFERNVQLQRLVERHTAALRQNSARLIEENRKRARTEALLSEVQRIAKVGGWMFDLDSETLQATEEFYRILELDPAQPITIDESLRCYDDEFRARLQVALCDAIGAGRPFDLEGGATTGNGTKLQVRVLCHVYLEDERASRLLGLVNDVTERRVAEACMAQSQKLESIGQLAAGIAHEINTPVQFVGDNIRFLQTSFDAVLAALTEIRAAANGEFAARLEAILQRADYEFLQAEIPAAIAQGVEGLERVAGLVRSMKDFAHPGNERAELADLNRAIASTVTVARNEWKYVADVDLQLAPDLPPVPCFVADLNQVVLNMIVNAAHAIDERRARDGATAKGSIRVATRAEPQWAVIEIADDGCGIPAPVMARIFDPFFTTKPVGKGTGQGLAISHNVVVQRHGGRIEVESTPGVGTRFVLRLPLVPAAVQEALA